MKRVAVLLPLVIGLLCGPSPAAFAGFSAAGGGSGEAGVGTLDAPSIISASASGTSVRIRWSAIDAPDAGPVDGYHVRRVGAETVAACGTSPRALVATTTCDDLGVPDGTFTYRVTAVFRGWTASSDPSPPVTVAGDSSAPAVISIVRGTTSPTNAAGVSWIVTFSEPVSGVGAGDFTLASAGLSGPAITSVAGTDPSASWTVGASAGSGAGTLGLNLVDDDSILDAAGNRLGGTGAGNGDASGPSYEIDRVAPAVSSITRAGTNPTTAATVSWTVVFSEDVSGFGAADLALINGGLTAPAITSVTGGPASWTVTASIGSGHGDLGLNLVVDGSILDRVGNALATPFTGPVYTIDRVPPAAPVSVALANGRGASSAYVNASTAASVSVTVSGVPELSASNTVVVRLTDDAGATVNATAPAITSTVTVAGIDARALADGPITIAAFERDALGNESASVSAPATKDTVAPVQTALASANAGTAGTTAGFADAGDTVTASFDEAIVAGSVPATADVSVATPNGANKPVTLSIPGLGTASTINALVENEYIVKNGLAIAFDASPLTQPSPTQVRVTLAACSANCVNRRAGLAHQVDFVAASTLTDLAGNAVTGGYAPQGTMLRFF